MSKEVNNLLIAASGTGGHIFPALTIAENVENDWNIFWIGIKNRCEEKIVPRKYKLFFLDFNSPSKKNILLFIQYIKIIFTTFEILRIMHEAKISLVFTTGGYISAPVIIASKILNIPVIFHESNLVPGSVTKYFGRYCKYVLTGFKETKRYLKRCKTIFTGTPIRRQFFHNNKLPDWVPHGEGFLIIILGGSQGAHGINKMINSSLKFLLSKQIRVVHISGDNKKINLKNINSENYVEVDFTNEIAALMQNCDLVISRAGSGAINELIHTKKPSILIPYPNSKNNHQEKNALFLSSIGGSILIHQKSDSDVFLRKTLIRIFNDQENDFAILETMKNNMSKLNYKEPISEIRKTINYFKNDS